ncbi:MAG TPA: type III-A CRISPR-associated protein Csm2 [Bacteroidales bacterium]|nr:type III-A CRISPR-associated protein Csm2 [Bacteroidales bacterium]
MSTIEKIKEKLQDLRNGKPSIQFDPLWIKDRITQKTIDWSEDIGFLICDKQVFNKNGRDFEKNGGNSVTTSQIRNFFGEVKRIQMKLSGNEDNWQEVNSSFLLLKPKLNYMAARVLSKNSSSRIALLKDQFEYMLAAIQVGPDYSQTVKEFIRFAELFEAILAFHKSYGGKE